MGLSKHDFFLVLLRSGLYGTTLAGDDIPASVDWDALYHTAKSQTVLALVADAISRLPEDREPPKEYTDKLRKFAFANMRSHMLLNSLVAKTFTILRAEGIRPVLLKGQGLAQCYTNPLLRQCGDIDIYVGQAQYARTCEVMAATLHNDQEPPHSDAKHTGYKHDQVEIEIHKYATLMQLPWNNRRFQPWSKAHLDDTACCEHIEIGGVEVELPDADFNAFYVFFHLWHHLMTGGIGVRHLCDVAMMLHHYNGKIDIAKLEDILDRLNLKKVWKSVGAILVDRLGLPASEMPLYDPKYSNRGDHILQAIMEVGNFGAYADKNIRTTQQQNLLTRKLQNFKRITRISALTFRAVPGHITVHYIFKTVGALINLLAGRQVAINM